MCSPWQIAVLSTSAMMRYAKESPAQEFLIVTECGLSDRLLLEVPEKKFYKSCKLCAYMKMITLKGGAGTLCVTDVLRLRSRKRPGSVPSVHLTVCWHSMHSMLLWAEQMRASAAQNKFIRV